MMAYKIEHYLSPADKQDIYLDWLSRLRDKQAKIAIIRRMTRIENDNFGDHRYCRDGVREMRIDMSPGYRIYYALVGQRVLLLLCGGDKRTQDADIKRSVIYFNDWQRRGDNEK
jgi:putative addiction module killer protein